MFAVPVMSFAFIPSAVRKKNHPPVLVSSHAPSTRMSVGAQITSESLSVDDSRGAKVLTFILLNNLTYLFLRLKPAQDQAKIKSKLMNMLRDL